MSRRNVVLLQVLAAAMFSTGGLMVKVISLSPQAIVGARGFIAAAVIVLFMRRPSFTWSVPQIGGALALAGAQFFFVLATKQTTAANAVLIQFAAPIYVAIFGIWFLKEKLKPADWLSMAAIGFGLLLFFSGELSAKGLWGNINALISGVALAWFILFMRKQASGSTIETVFLGNILAGFIGLPALLQASPTVTDWAGLLFLGIFQMALPFMLVTITIRHLTAIEAILIQTLEPILNPIWVFLIVGEVPERLALIGGMIVLASVSLRGMLASQKARQHPDKRYTADFIKIE